MRLAEWEFCLPLTSPDRRAEPTAQVLLGKRDLLAGSTGTLRVFKEQSRPTACRGPDTLGGALVVRRIYIRTGGGFQYTFLGQSGGVDISDVPRFRPGILRHFHRQESRPRMLGTDSVAILPQLLILTDICVPFIASLSPLSSRFMGRTASRATSLPPASLRCPPYHDSQRIWRRHRSPHSREPHT
jgi:hypothetical protein